MAIKLGKNLEDSVDPVDAEHELAYGRRFPRRRMKGHVGLLHGGTYYVVDALEIGEGGLSVESHEAIEVGRDTVLNFFIPERAFVSVTAQVIYASEPKLKGLSALKVIGLRFRSLHFEDKRAIRDYIADKTLLEATQEKAI